LDGIDEQGDLKEAAREAVMEEMRRNFKPEFLNRIDEIVMFKPLHIEEIIKIIGLLLEDIRSRLAERHIDLAVTDKAINLIAKSTYTPVYGARPVKRYLQKNIETEIAKLLIKGELGDNSTVTVDEDDGDLVVSGRG
ncbi:MAG: type VI secretion system ATPase TssH, partial [Clostridiales bacterium]|nr:type VI secretion system ATPase TssH [Clostridiales bacterium]